MSLSKPDLRRLYALVDAAVKGEPAADDRAELEAIRDRLVKAIAVEGGRRGFGPLVFRWVLPFAQPRAIVKGKSAGKTVRDVLCPSLNEYGSMPVWKRAALYRALDGRILAELAKWPRALLRGERRARGVRVVRYSSKCPDEVTVDVVGGKVPVDRLVVVGVLSGDTIALLEREGDWKPAPRGEGCLVVEVFDLL